MKKSELADETNRKKKIEREENVKSLCCKSDITRKGRANYVCSKCGKDNTLYLVVLLSNESIPKGLDGLA